MHRTDSRAGQHRNRRLRNVRKINDDAIAFFDVVPFQHVREPADFAMQLLIGERALVTRFALPNDRGLVPTRPCEMTIQAVFRNIQFPAHEPFRERWLPFDNLLPWRAPEQLLCFAHPELGRLADRFSIHSPILSETPDPRLAAEARYWLENAFFDEMRFDVVVHEQSLICRGIIFGKRGHPAASGLWPVDRKLPNC